jgi:hypothetical protein
MRGRTFKNSYIIADEMQNSTPNQMKIITTRIGDNSKMIITGDLNQSDLQGKNGLEDLIQKCEKCYSTMRKVEENRERKRNYASEHKLNPTKYFEAYIKSAGERNLQFEISLDIFTEFINKPCYYCKKYDTTEVVGIDRIDSFKGYTPDNIVASCKICNMMKQQLSMKEFAEHVEKIYESFVVNFLDITENTKEDSLPSYRIKPRDIVSLYSKKKLDTYIDICKEDNLELDIIFLG